MLAHSAIITWATRSWSSPTSVLEVVLKPQSPNTNTLRPACWAPPGSGEVPDFVHPEATSPRTSTDILALKINIRSFH